MSTDDATFAAEAENGWYVIDSFTYDDGVQYARVVRIEDHEIVHEQVFSHPDAFEDAGSYIAAAIEVEEYSLEERLGPFGLEWQRERGYL